MNMSEPHIIYIITKLELGGAQKVCLSLFEGLPAHALNASLISSSQGYYVSQVKERSSVYLLPELQREISVRALWHEFKAFYTLIKTLRKLKKQSAGTIIVHTHSTKAGLMGRWAAVFAGIKKRVHTIHGFAFHEHQNKFSWLSIYFLEALTSLITTHFVCVSDKDAQTGSSLFPLFKKKHTVIRAAIEWDKFVLPAYMPQKFPETSRAEHNFVPQENMQALTKTQKLPELFIFGTIACFKPQKNLFDLLRAFEKTHALLPHTRLEIIGDGEQRAQLEHWIQEHNLTHAVTLHGWQNNVAQFLKNWHVFTLSSLWEGLPCAIIEARMLKLPVICYNTGGISDVIFHDQNGLLCEQKNWQKLSDHLSAISNNEELYARLQAYPDELDQFHNSYMIKQHVNLYKKLQH
jgi:glycosyltransferase involved in cell wall biosynthesis